jgi:mRNA interferase MazF
VRRGEIWVIAGGNYAGKPRPGIVIQDDSLSALHSVTVIPLTSHESDSGRIRVSISLEKPDGLTITSFAQVDKIMTVKAANVSKRIGALSLPELRAVERSLLNHLGIGSSRS